MRKREKYRRYAPRRESERQREREREGESCEAPLRERDGDIKILGSYERNRDR